MSNYTSPPQSVATCFDAQVYLGSANEYGNDPFNVDVGGAFTACANIAINMLLPFLVAWSPSGSDISPSAFLFLSQAIPVLVATLSSVGSDNLSLFDAHFAASVTASPIAFYIVGSCMRYPFCKKEPLLFTKIRPTVTSTDSDRGSVRSGTWTAVSSTSEAGRTPRWKLRLHDKQKAFISVLGGAILPVLWLAVSLITSFSSTAFRNSHYCKGMTVPKYAEFMLTSSFTGVLDILGRRDLMDDFSKRRGLGFLALIWLLALAVYLVHHREQIVEECIVPMDKIKREEHRTGMRRLKLAKEYVLLSWRAPKVSWNIITSAHPTMLVVLIFCLHWSWTLSVSGNALTWDRTQLSYGQVLSVFVPVPALFSFLSMIFGYAKRINSIRTFLTSLRAYIGEGARFIFTGRKEWSVRDDGTREWERDYFHWSRKRWTITLVSCFAYMGGQAVWIVFYVRAGSMPNTRIKINQPHKNWKPYSVCMYINGYICSIVGIFLTVAFFDFLPRWFNSEVAFTVDEQTYEMRPDNLNWQVYQGLVGEHNSSLRRNRGGLRALAFALSVVFAVVFCAGPVFAPYLALPLAQEWHWSHDCDHYPVEIILNGQPNPFDVATISMYVARPGSPKRTKMHDLKFRSPDQQSYPNLRVLEYIDPSPLPTSDGSSIIPAPTTKALVLDTAQRKFAGCTIRLSDVLGDLPVNTTTRRDGLQRYLEGCTDGGGSFEKRPYLRFAITHSNSITNSTVYLRAESEEWAYPNDAPSFILKFDDGPGSSSVDLSLRPTSMRTALTKRNHPTILKMCSNEVEVTVETLGPLSVAMEAMNRFAVFISRPRVLSDA